ncbi:MAG: type II 3-dehydroquinate dehydratase [Rhodothermales bacterium]|nr:type II 3-dehydroquinate dehydratase [Rhodothermales bacterium]MBO6779387.1 type II 3-dehydroquinate dehydratase [Rhodothermales bacterium]
MHILIVNGPNLNLLGTRETDIYGAGTLEDLEQSLLSRFPGVVFEFFQSNVEGELVNRLHDTAECDGVVFNPAGYSHTSVALRDCMAAIPVPVVEVHISNIYAREDFRHTSLTGAAAAGVISGLGFDGYALAVQHLLDRSR